MNKKTLIKKINKIENLPIKYYSRLGMFKASNGNLTFNPLTYLGHSYQWYEITKKVNNVVLLNTYGYSMTTRKHVNKLMRLLSVLGIKYKSIQAPKGLQNLDVALEYHTLELERYTLKQAYARNGGYEYQIAIHIKAISLLNSFGYKLSNKQAKELVLQAKTERLNRLEHQRKVRMSKVKLVLVTNQGQVA